MELEEDFQQHVAWLAFDQVEQCLRYPEDPSFTKECHEVWKIVNDTFTRLPLELRWEFALEWDARMLSQLCAVSRSFHVLCENDLFWKAKFFKDIERREKYHVHEETSWKQNYILAFTHSVEPIQDLTELEIRLMAKNHGIIPTTLEELVNTFRFYQLVRFRESMVLVAFTEEREEIHVENTVRSLELFFNVALLSSEITALSFLQKLYLSENELTTLPPEIGNLSSLQKLYLFENQLTTLPTEIGNLSSLQILILRENQLTTLPPEIGNLSSLRELDLSANQLTTLLPEIGNLSSLQTLDLCGNQLTTLPPEIGNLSSLQTLDLCGNQLTTLPPEIGYLRNLRRLNLSENPLTHLPDEIVLLTNLHRLFLAGTPIEYVPPDMCAIVRYRYE